jgi:SAM-dependent methyltransferase
MSSGKPDSGNAYDERYFKDTYGCDGLKRFDMHWWSIRWYASMAARCLRDTGGNRLLEIGCGHGFMLARLEDRCDTFGVDISPYAIEQARRFAPGSTCLVADIEDGLPPELAAGSFDLVVAKYVFEHLRNPLRAMQAAASLLRPGGMLFFSVPNTESLGARRKGDAWYAQLDPTHCSLLPPDEWLRIVHDAGLRVARESADGFWDLPYIGWLPAWTQFPVFIGPTALSCLSGRAILPPRFGENLLVFARKPEPRA